MSPGRLARLAALDPSGLVLLHRRAHASYRRGGRVTPYVLRAIAMLVYGAEIHPAAVLARGVRFAHTQGVVIGEGVVVEDDVEIYSGVVLGHDGSWAFPTVRRGATLFSGCVVVGGVVVGERARVGANAVVLHDVPPRATAVGVPARVLGPR